jgi:hypothetical protein
MTQAITPVPVDARTADWPRKVATVLNRLQNAAPVSGGTSLAIDGGDASGSGGSSMAIDGGSA